MRCSCVRRVVCVAVFGLLLFGVVSPGLADDWVESRRSGDWTYLSEYALADPPAFFGELEQLRTDVERTLGVKTRGKPIELKIFNSKRAYQSHLRKRIPEGAQRRALFVSGPESGLVYVYYHAGMMEDVRHECTHALLNNALPYLPMWLDEGLAVYFEDEPANRKPGTNRLSGIRWSLRFGWRPNLPKLERKDNLTQMGAGDYTHAWAWAHFLLHGPPEIRRAFQNYLEQIQNGEPPGDFSQYIEKRMANTATLIKSHLKTWNR